MNGLARTASQWFHEAERVYVEQHQGCAWCGGAYRVHRTRHEATHVYNCQRCDFQVSFNAKLTRYHVIPGEDVIPGSDTMREQPVFHVT